MVWRGALLSDVSQFELPPEGGDAVEAEEIEDEDKSSLAARLMQQARMEEALEIIRDAPTQ